MKLDQALFNVAVCKLPSDCNLFGIPFDVMRHQNILRLCNIKTDYGTEDGGFRVWEYHCLWSQLDVYFNWLDDLLIDSNKLSVLLTKTHQRMKIQQMRYEGKPARQQCKVCMFTIFAFLHPPQLTFSVVILSLIRPSVKCIGNTGNITFACDKRSVYFMDPQGNASGISIRTWDWDYSWSHGLLCKWIWFCLWLYNLYWEFHWCCCSWVDREHSTAASLKFWEMGRSSGNCYPRQYQHIPHAGALLLYATNRQILVW